MEPHAHMQMQKHEERHASMQTMTLQDDLGVDEPQNWTVTKKIKPTLAAFGYSFTLLYGATAYTAGLPGVMAEFNVSMTKAILPFSLYVWGIMFAPLYSPHVSERFGRNPLYIVANLGLGVFTIGAAYSQSYTSLAVTRFFAGLCGGSAAVQIEGTFADVWPALFTNSYYVGIMCAQYFGAAAGAIVGFHVVPATDWRYTQYTTLMFVLAAFLLGISTPETYRRELVRQRDQALKQPSPLGPALSGSTFRQMARLTLIDPLVIVVSQPVVMMITLYLALNFGVLFSWFISVPVVLETVAKFAPQQVGSAFSTAIGGTAAAATVTFVIDQLNIRLQRSQKRSHAIEIESRLYPAMFGAVLLTASIFWIAFTANSKFDPRVPVVGNGFYVMGSAMVLISFISYLFDAYGPQGILSALTVAACTRIAFAGTIPLIIIPAFMSITGQWTLAVFGFISIAFLPFPFLIFFIGKRSRMSSRFFNHQSHSQMQMEMNSGPKYHSHSRNETESGYGDSPVHTNV